MLSYLCHILVLQEISSMFVLPIFIISTFFNSSLITELSSTNNVSNSSLDNKSILFNKIIAFLFKQQLINKAINTLYELGKATGSAIRRIIKKSYCKVN